MASIVSAGTTSSTALNMSADTSGVLQLASNNGTTAVTIGTDQSVTFAGSVNAPNSFGFKNRLINGAMVIDQRNAGALINPMADATYYLDRWRASATQTSKLSIGQNAGSVTPPAGFTNYMGFTSLSAYSITSGDIFGIAQNIEGYNVADLAWGTASASTVTLSFWVRSSLTGTFGGSLRNSASNRSYPFSYTVSSANTWEQKSITIAGDTSGTWLTTNGIGILLFLSLGSGSTYSGTAGSWSGSTYTSATGATSVVGTNGATFYITGVQLEKGSTATSFDYRPYSAELAMCQRYFERSYDIGTATATVTNAGANWSYINFATGSANDFSTQVTFQSSKRAIPTMTVYSPDTGASGNIGSAGGDKAATASFIGMHGCTIYGNLAGQTNAQCRAHWLASSEL
jgi:hypothetical protein